MANIFTGCIILFAINQFNGINIRIAVINGYRDSTQKCILSVERGAAIPFDGFI